MNHESLSALFDGECKGAELDQLLSALEREPALRSEWSRLCVAHQAVHGIARKTDEALVRNVMAAIAREPHEPHAVKTYARSLSWTWLRPLAGYALAAGVGAVAVFGLLSKQNGETFAPAITAQSDAISASPVRRRSELADSQLNSYLIDYSNYRAQQGMGALGYARFAAHDAVYHPVSDR